MYTPLPKTWMYWWMASGRFRNWKLKVENRISRNQFSISIPIFTACPPHSLTGKSPWYRQLRSIWSIWWGSVHLWWCPLWWHSSAMVYLSGHGFLNSLLILIFLPAVSSNSRIEGVVVPWPPSSILSSIIRYIVLPFSFLRGAMDWYAPNTFKLTLCFSNWKKKCVLF